MNTYLAKWSGAWPCLCHGEWSLYKNNEDISYMIPYELKSNDMNTFGEYETWHFEDWEEVWESYEDGLDCDEWLKENKSWISRITNSEIEQEEIFKTFQKEGFRWNSCGGCI